MQVRRDRLLGRGGAARLHPRRLPAAAGAARPPAPRPARRAAPASWPSVSLIVAAHDEEAVIAAKVANALALDYPRELLEVIVASDGSTDRTAELAREAGADLVLELPRAGKVPAQNAAAERAGGELLAFSDANASWQPGRAAGADRPVRRCQGCATSAGRRGCSTRAGPTRRAPTGAMSSPCASSSRRSPGSPPATARSTPFAPPRTWRSGPAASHDLSFPFMLTKRGFRAVYAPAAVAEEKMVATTEGEFARKRRMMRGIFDEVVGDGMLAPARLRGRCTRSRSPATAGFAMRLRSCTSSPWCRISPCSTPGTIYAVTLAAQLLLLFGGGARRGGADRALPDRPLLRADDRLDRGRVLGPAAPRDPGDLGEGGGDPVRRALDLVVAGIALVVASPLLAVAAIAIKLDSRGPVLYLARRVGRDGAEFELYKLRTMHTGNDPVGVGTPVLAGDPRVTRVGGLPAPLLARRAAEPVQRDPRRDVGGRPAADARRAGRRLHARTSAAGSRSSPGSPDGPRSTAAPGSPGTSGSSSTSGTSSNRSLGARPADPRPHRAPARHRPRPLRVACPPCPKPRSSCATSAPPTPRRSTAGSTTSG